MVKQGGSQLAQLKTALHSTGISREGGSNARKRKRGSDTSQQQRAARIEEITSKLNPFDLKVTKPKHDIAGKKVKGVMGRPAASKQMGLQQRKNTLLSEYKDRGRAGGIVDRRYGEKNPHLTQEQRMLRRFTHERQKAAKVSFNLDDDEELTHYGQSLDAADDFERTGLALDAEEVDAEDHFGGFDSSDDATSVEDDPDAPPRKKTKAEIMNEVMEKSKRHKHERQAQREADDNLRHEVDQELDVIQRLLFSMPEDRISLLVKPAVESNTDDVPSHEAPTPLADQQYDRALRELVFEKRARPTDRLKTEEEQALEEKQRLEKAERARLRRMNGEADYDSEEEGVLHRRKRAPQADDLDDDFVADEDTAFLGAGLPDDASSHESSDNSTDDSETDQESETQSLEGDLAETPSESSVGSEDEDLVQPKDITSHRKITGKPKELPYTFPCPSTHDEFLDIAADVPDEDLITIVQRIRALYHPSLAEGNKAKLEVFTSVLIEHALYQAATSGQPFTSVTSLSPQIYALSRTYTAISARTFISKLVIMQRNLARGLAQGPSLPDSRTFPGIAEIAVLRLIGAVWSTSDKWHPVVTPAMLLMGQYLGQCRVRSLADIASGLFICTIFIQYQSLSKRLLPEAVTFVINTILHLAPHDIALSDVPGAFPSPDLGSSSLRHLKLADPSVQPKPPNLLLLIRDGDSSAQSKADLLALAITLCDCLADHYNALDGFIELFEPISAIFDMLDTQALPSQMQNQLSRTTIAIQKRLKFARQSRQPLLLQAHKPIAIASIAPKFDLNYSGRVFDDSPGAQANKLKAMYKKEKKSAIRELRRDTKFLAVEKAQQAAKKDRDYQEKMIRAVGAISSERAEEKQMERMKSLSKLRAAKQKRR